MIGRFVEFVKNKTGRGVKETSTLMVRPVGTTFPFLVSDVVKLPVFPYHLKLAYDLYYWSDVLRTVIRALVWETFRNGITFEKEYEAKCTKCGATYNKLPETCEICGNDLFEQPDPRIREELERWVSDVNLNDESLVDVLMACDFDLNIADNAYLVVIKKYEFNEQGEVVAGSVSEVVRADPLVMRLVMNKYGRMGLTDDENVVAICLEHRDRYKLVTQDEMSKGVRCEYCGKRLYPAFFEMDKGGKKIYYTDGEVLHFKKFTHGLGYGYSMIYTLLMKVLVLLKMDYFVLMSYHLQRPPKGLLVLRGNRESIAKSWEWLMEQARLNPYAIYPLVVEGSESTVGRRVAEWIDLSFNSREIDFISYRDELRRAIGLAYGVSPMFHEGSVGGGLGMSLEIMVTNRAIEMEQRIFNDKVLLWLCRQLGYSGWRIKLVPNERKDVSAELQRTMMRIQIAQQMKTLGYDVKMVEGEDGIDFKYEEMSPEQRLRMLLQEIIEATGAPVSVDELLKDVMLKLQGKVGEIGEISEVVGAEQVPESKPESIISPEDLGVAEKLSVEEQRLEGDTATSQPRKTEQRFEGEPQVPRK